MLKLTAIIPEGLSLHEEKKYLKQTIGTSISEMGAIDAVDRDGQIYNGVYLGIRDKASFVLNGDNYVVAQGIALNIQPLIDREKQLKTPKPTPPKNPLPFASSM